jgi:hypothetical protein
MKAIARLTAVISPLLLTLFSAHSFAEFKNTSYSYFTLGSEHVSYSESLPVFSGASFESEFTTSGLSQRSGGYTALAEDSPFGFIIATQSTLLAKDGDETWDANWDTDGNGSNDGAKTVQTDQASLNQANLDLLGVYHLKNGLFFTSGLHYQKVSFTRFNFQSTLDTEDFSNFTLENNSTYQKAISSIEDTGTYTFENSSITITTIQEAIDLLHFKPELLTPVVAEELTSFNIVAGIGYDSFFIDRKPGMRYKFSFNLGTPLYLHVLNTNVGGSDRTLSETLPGGFDSSFSGAIGYQFSKKISVMLSLYVTHAERESISVTNSVGQKVSLPDNTLTSTVPELAFIWGF